MSKAISEACKAAVLSQTAMSKAMDIPLRTIQDWESAKRKCPTYVERLIIKELKEIAEGKA